MLLSLPSFCPRKTIPGVSKSLSKLLITTHWQKHSGSVAYARLTSLELVECGQATLEMFTAIMHVKYSFIHSFIHFTENRRE